MNNNINNQLPDTINQNSIVDISNENTVKTILEKIRMQQAVIKSQLRENHDYGIIPGTGKKPTLLKPGAEKIATLLNATISYEIITSTRDFNNKFFDYLVKCKLIKRDGVVIEGMGSANNREPKFVREDKTDPTGRVLEHAYTMDNNVLKMAYKRAFVAAVLVAASLSDVFTQDFDDLDDEDIKDIAGNKATQNSPEAKLEKPITQAQANRLYAIAKSHNVSNEQAKEIIKKHGYNLSSEILTKDYEKIIAEIESVASV